MRNGKVYGKFVLTVYVFDFVQFCIFVCLFEKKHSATVFRVGIIKNIMLSFFNFYESSK